MTLPPEMEALVEEVARKLEPGKWGVLDLFKGDRNRLDEYQIAALDMSLNTARAIIPLIYTAGHRAGIEEAAKVADAYARGPSAQKVHGENLAAAIRSISEQEKSRG